MLTILMLISHTLSDFMLQTEKMIKEKSNMNKWGYIKHALVLFGTSLPIIIFVESICIDKVLESIILIIIIHLILDFIKEKFLSVIQETEFVNYYRLGFFITSQFLHIIIILAIANSVTLNFNAFNEYFKNEIFLNKGISYANLKTIFITVYVAFSGAYFIPLLFNIIYENVNDYGTLLNNKFKENLNQGEHEFIDEVKTGKWIGILERILILIFLFTNQLPSIGFIIAIKSLARFKMMDSKIFSEYYLLGTFMSMAYTFLGFEVLNSIL